VALNKNRDARDCSVDLIGSTLLHPLKCLGMAPEASAPLKLCCYCIGAVTTRFAVHYDLKSSLASPLNSVFNEKKNSAPSRPRLQDPSVCLLNLYIHPLPLSENLFCLNFLKNILLLYIHPLPLSEDFCLNFLKTFCCDQG
jgi:hypothetical protein